MKNVVLLYWQDLKKGYTCISRYRNGTKYQIVYETFQILLFWYNGIETPSFSMY